MVYTTYGFQEINIYSIYYVFRCALRYLIDWQLPLPEGVVLVPTTPPLPHSLEIRGWTEAQPRGIHNVGYPVRGTLAAIYGYQIGNLYIYLKQCHLRSD